MKRLSMRFNQISLGIYEIERLILGNKISVIILLILVYQNLTSRISKSVIINP